MRVEIRYPHLQAILDDKGAALYRLFLVPGDPERIEKQPGEILVDLIELDLTEYRAMVEALAQRLEQLPLEWFSWSGCRELSSQLLETAYLLQKQNELLAELVFGRVSELTGESDIEPSPNGRRNVLLCALRELRSVNILQTRFRMMATACLNYHAKKFKSANERLRQMQSHYDEYKEFTWKTSTTFAPVHNGYLDRSALIGLRGGESEAELLTHYQRSTPKGASVVLCHILESLEEVVWFDFIQAMASGTGLHRCRECKRYFLPADPRQVYCSRTTSYGKTCKEIGALKHYKKTVADDLYLKQFEALRTAMYFRKARYQDKASGKKTKRDLSSEEYGEWLSSARACKQRYVSGEITGDEMLATITPSDYRPKEKHDRNTETVETVFENLD